jgi:hypothetical protein
MVRGKAGRAPDDASLFAPSARDSICHGCALGGNRSGSLLDAAVGADLERTTERANDAYLSTSQAHRDELVEDQQRFARTAKPSGTMPELKRVTSRIRTSAELQKSSFGKNLKRTVLSRSGSRLKARYPHILQHAARRLGPKILKRIPASVIPFGQLIFLWGAYDLGDSAIEVWSGARDEIGAATFAEADALSSTSYQWAFKAVQMLEISAHQVRCSLLREALLSRQSTTKVRDYSIRCSG